MGDEPHIDWTCEHCDARRFTCCYCGHVTIVDGDPESEMCHECWVRRTAYPKEKPAPGKEGK